MDAVTLFFGIVGIFIVGVVIMFAMVAAADYDIKNPH